MPTLVDLLRFLQYEDKIRHGDFDKKLHETLSRALLKMTMDIEMQLLVAVILSTFDNPDQTFEEKLTESVSLEKLIMAAFNWDSTGDSNRELIEIYENSTQSHPDEVNDTLVFNVVTYTKRKLSAHYEKDRQSKITSGANEGKGNETKPDYDIEVTGDLRTDRHNANGRYKIHGRKNNAPYFKRTNGSDFFVYRDFLSGHWRWQIHWDLNSRGKSYIESDDRSPPETLWNISGRKGYEKSSTFSVKLVKPNE